MRVAVLVHGEVPDTLAGRRTVAAIESHAAKLIAVANENGATLEVHAERPIEMGGKGATRP